MTAKGLIAALLVSPLLASLPGDARACSTKVVWRADLTGAGMDRAVQTDAKGVAVFEFNFHENIGTPDATITIDLQGATDVTSIDLRGGDRTKPGPVLFTLYTRKQGSLRPHFSKLITEKDLLRQTDSKVQTFADMVNAVTEHTVYITVNTGAHANGELRGNITMHKVSVYSAVDTGVGHNAQLHAQAAKGKTN